MVSTPEKASIPAGQPSQGNRKTSYMAWQIFALADQSNNMLSFYRSVSLHKYSRRNVSCAHLCSGRTARVVVSTYVHFPSEHVWLKEGEKVWLERQQFGFVWLGCREKCKNFRSVQARVVLSQSDTCLGFKLNYFSDAQRSEATRTAAKHIVHVDVMLC